MRPFPAYDDLKFLVGDRLAQIRMNPSTLDFMFDSMSSITAEFQVEFASPADTLHRHDVQDKLGPDAVTFHQLTNQQVIAIDVGEFRLTLFFEGGGVLHILSEASPYESGHIWRAIEGRSPDILVF